MLAGNLVAIKHRRTPRTNNAAFGTWFMELIVVLRSAFDEGGWSLEFLSSVVLLTEEDGVWSFCMICVESFIGVWGRWCLAQGRSVCKTVSVMH
jgi:hypothetical protein